MTYLWRNYVDKAAETAVFPEEIKLEYLALALAGEIGELCNILKKVLRKDFTVLEKREKIIEELGGILWYLVMLGKEGNYLVVDLNQLVPGIKAPEGLADKKAEAIFKTAAEMFIDASKVLKPTFRHQFESQMEHNMIASDLRLILNRVQDIAIACDATLEDVAKANIALLSMRQIKGTIQGHERKE